jgi:hypothetical protein
MPPLNYNKESTIQELDAGIRSLPLAVLYRTALTSLWT